MSKIRESGIELLKIIAMLLIAMNHTIQTLGDTENVHYISDYVLDFGSASTNAQNVILACMQSSGAWGNIIFFVCSAWFLLESKEVNYKKVVYMIADVWVVNFVIFVVLEAGGWFPISWKDIIKTLLPNTFGINWYITFYILFYLIHTKLNQIIQNCTQRELLTSVIAMLVMYYGIVYVKTDLLAANDLVRFITIYFTIAYMKTYMKCFCENRKLNFGFFVIGLLGTLIMVIIMNYMGLSISALEDKVLHFSMNNSSPFLLLSSIALFNLFRTKKFVNMTINKISSLSLLIYIIHENLLLRQYVRPNIWIYIHEEYGYSKVILYAFAIMLGIFIWGLCMAAIYRATLQKVVHKIANKIYEFLCATSDRLLSILMKIR